MRNVHFLANGKSPTMNVQAMATKVLMSMIANTVQAQSEPPEVMCLSAVGGLWSSDDRMTSGVAGGKKVGMVNIFVGRQMSRRASRDA